MKGIEVKKDDLNYNRNKITLYQMNSENVDPKKINNFNIAVIDGNAIKKKTMKKVVNNIMPLMKK